MRKTVTVVLTGMLVMGALFVAGSAATAGDAGKKIVIGLSMPSLQSTFFEGEKAMAEKVAKQEGVELITVIADGDPNKQKSQIEDLISKKVDAVVCVSQDSKAIASSVADCKAAGIPFIGVGRLPADLTDVTAAIVCDNETCAKADVEAMVKQAKNLGIDKIKAIEVVGGLKDQNAVERTEGFKKYAKAAGIEIVAEVASEWDVDRCFSRLTDTLNTVEDFNAMYVPSDFLLPTIMSVLSANDRWVKAGDEGHVIITSIDGDPTAIKMIKDGFVYATANTDAFDFGRLGVQAAIDLARGKKLPQRDIPVPTVALTKEIIEKAGDTIWGNVY